MRLKKQHVLILIVLMSSLFLISGCIPSKVEKAEDTPSKTEKAEGKGCCHPPCVEVTKQDCEMHYGTTSGWSEGSCEICKEHTCPECKIGCCSLTRTQMMKWECELNGGKWYENECPEEDWYIDEELVYTCPGDCPTGEFDAGNPMHLQGYFYEYSEWGVSEIKRVINVQGKAIGKAEHGEFGYQTEWDLSLEDDFIFTTIEPEEVVKRTVSGRYWTGPGTELECNWIRKPSLFTKTNIKFNLLTDKLLEYDPTGTALTVPHLNIPSIGVYSTLALDVDFESCSFDAGEYTCTGRMYYNGKLLNEETWSWRGIPVDSDYCEKYDDFWIETREKGWNDIYINEMTEESAILRPTSSAWSHHNTYLTFSLDPSPAFKIKKSSQH